MRRFTLAAALALTLGLGAPGWGAGTIRLGTGFESVANDAQHTAARDAAFGLCTATNASDPQPDDRGVDAGGGDRDDYGGGFCQRTLHGPCQYEKEGCGGGGGGGGIRPPGGGDGEWDTISRSTSNAFTTTTLR